MREGLTIGSISSFLFAGRPLDPAQKLRVAINNYRYTGGGHYSYKGLPIVYRLPQEIRELLIEYLKRTKKMPVKADGNWRITPEAACEAIVAEAKKEARDRSRERSGLCARNTIASASPRTKVIDTLSSSC